MQQGIKYIWRILFLIVCVELYAQHSSQIPDPIDGGDSGKTKCVALLYNRWIPSSTTVEQSSDKDIILSPPKKRSVDPNSFPSFSFLAFNDSDTEWPVRFNLLLPDGWEIITFRVPSSIAPQTSERIHVTVTVPRNALADKYYYLGLIVSWGTLSDTTAVQITINENRSIKLINYAESMQVIPGEPETQNYVFQNDGNVMDTLFFNVDLPENWDLVGITDRLVLKPQSQAIAYLAFHVPETESPGVQALITLHAESVKEMPTVRSIELKDSLVFIPQEKEIIDLLFKAAETARMKKKMIITYSKTSMVEREDQAILARTRVRVLRPKITRFAKSLHPILPVHIGFALNRIEKERYPGMALYVKTGVVDLGGCTAEMELTQKINSAPLNELLKDLLSM